MNDLTIELHQDGSKHLYLQIYEHIKMEIRKGKLPEGERLPSTRSLAEFLQVSRSTVELAYDQLLSEGYIMARPYRGHFVCEIESFLDMIESSKNPIRKEEKEKEAYAIDFSPNAIDMSAFPFSTWKKITKDILVNANSEMFASGSPKGDYNLRQTICSYLHSSRGVNCLPEQIIVGAGNDYLLMLLEKILGRHVKIAMENPTYKRAYCIFESFAYRISTITLDAGGMSAEELRKSEADVAYVMPSHQYPTGIVMPIGRRMELLRWASEGEHRYLIEDDYDSEFRFKGKPVPSLQASDVNDKVIYIGTFSKSIAPAIRISYMVLPLPLLEIYENKYSFYSTTVSRIDQRILNEFIEKGHFERHLNKMRKIYRDKHDLLLNELKIMESDFRVSGEDAGLHILLKDKKKRSDKELAESAAKAGIKVYRLSDAYLTPNEKPIRNPNINIGVDDAVILGYAALSKEQIIEGIRVLKTVWR